MSKPTPSGFCLARGEYFMICPYNPTHQITNHRYVIHVAKCRTAYKKRMEKEGKPVDMLVCRFNYTHHVPAPELLAHQEKCADQHNIVRRIKWVKNPEGVLEEERGQRQGLALPGPRQGIVNPSLDVTTDDDSQSDFSSVAEAGPSTSRGATKAKGNEAGKKGKPVPQADESDWEHEVRLLDLTDKVQYTG